MQNVTCHGMVCTVAALILSTAQAQPPPTATPSVADARRSLQPTTISADVHISGVSGRSVNLPYVLSIRESGIDWTKWLTSITAITNLLVVATFAIMTRRERIRERSIDAAREIDAFWIQNLVLEPHFVTIRQFFSETEREMREYMDACNAHAHGLLEQAQGKTGNFSTRLDNISRIVVEPVNIISVNLSGRLAASTDSIQEAVTGFYSLHVFQNELPLTEFRRLQDNFWRTLFAGQRELAFANDGRSARR